jgi:hypothetical protein
MAVVAVCEPRERADFSALVLRGLVEIGHYEEELCLELGLSYWINHGEMRLDEAAPALLAMRIALIRASGMALDTEPVPFVGVSHRVDVVNLAAYLRGLIVRAAGRASCSAEAIVEQALGLMGAPDHPTFHMRAG